MWPALLGRWRCVAVFIDEMQDLTPEDVSASAQAAMSCPRPARRSWWGAGLPHLPRCCQPRSHTRSGSSGTSELTVLTPRGRAGAAGACRTRGCHLVGRRARSMARPRRYPYFVQAYGKAAWICAGSPISAGDVAWQLLRPRRSWPWGSSAPVMSVRRLLNGTIYARWRA